MACCCCPASSSVGATRLKLTCQAISQTIPANNAIAADLDTAGPGAEAADVADVGPQHHGQLLPQARLKLLLPVPNHSLVVLLDTETALNHFRLMLVTILT